jgi:hypothetical protein
MKKVAFGEPTSNPHLKNKPCSHQILERNSSVNQQRHTFIYCYVRAARPSSLDIKIPMDKQMPSEVHIGRRPPVS